jgi:general nucleoside transport system permease protein
MNNGSVYLWQEAARSQRPLVENMDNEKPSSIQGTRQTIWQNLLKKSKDLIPIVLGLLGGFVIGGMIILAAGHNPFTSYYSLLMGAIGDTYNLAATLGRAVPIIGCGIGAALAFKAGLFNIGGEGQLVLGALGATLVALFFPPGPLTVVLAILAGVIFGGLWGLLSGWLETRFNIPILISSLLMNYIAVGFVSYMISFPLIEPGGSRNQTHPFPDATRIPKLIEGTTLHWGVFIIVLIVILVSLYMYKTVGGYELRMFGSNREFAETGGIKPKRLTLLVMMVSGIIVGITGANQVLGVFYRLIDTSLTLPGYFWTGAMAAILSNNNPLGVVIAGLFFSALQTGAAGMERATEVPFELSYIMQAIMIVLIAVRGILKPVRRGED